MAERVLMLRIVALLVLAAALARPAAAANVEWWESYLAGATAILGGPADSDWRINIGASVAFAPDYPGSTEYEAVPLPLIDIEWRGSYFLSTQRGLGVVLFRTGLFRAGTRLTYDRGRKSSENARLSGLRDIESSIEGGAFFEYYRKNWRFAGDIRKGITDGHQGIVASGSAAVGGRFSDNTNLILGAETHYADSTYMNAYFGRGSFIAESGVRDIGGFMNFVYMLTPQAYLALDSRVSLLLGDAAGSPLSVDDVQYFLGSVVRYRF